MSDSSDEGLDGITTPYGPATRGRTHPGGNSKVTCTQRSVRPPAIRRMDKKTSQTGLRSPVKWALHKNFQVSQSPVTGHPATGHWIWKISTQGKSIVTGHQTLYQPTFNETHAMGMEFTNNNSKSFFITPGTGLSNMSDPNVVIEPSNNNRR